AWRLGANADCGMAPAMQASPITWILGCNVDSNVTGLMGHQPVRSATPAVSAMRPAFCGGTILATAARWRPNSVTTVLVAGSTEVTLPPFESDTHSRWFG